MALHDILLSLDSYPDATPAKDVDWATEFCARIGRTVSAVSLHVEIPLRSNFLAEKLLQLEAVAVEEEGACMERARAGLARFREHAIALGVFGTAQTMRATVYDAPDRLAALVRTRDLLVAPYGDSRDAPRAMAEGAIFGSGRPVIILPPAPSTTPGKSLKVAIAWDGSRPAARAVADALPILGEAAEVRILTILGDKPDVHAGAAADLVRHLTGYGLPVVVDEVEAHREPTGHVLDRYLAQHGFDLLVMGAFGHSRMREFVLGGATRRILENPSVPVLLSH